MSSKHEDLQKDLDIIKGNEVRSGAKGPNASRQQMKSKKAKKRSLPADGEKSEDSGMERAASAANVRQKIAHKRSRTESPSGGKLPEKTRRTSGFGKIKLGGKQNGVSSNPSTPKERSRPDPLKQKQTPRSRGCIDPQAVPVEAIQFKVGWRIEAMDHGAWYKARIIEVDNTKSEILVHFDGWRAKFDTWYPMTSALIRGRTQVPNKDGEVVFEEGEDVLARWTDGNFYPATVVKVKDTGSCVVMYFDGMKKLIRKNVMKKMNDKEKKIATEAANKLLQIPNLIPSSSEIAGKPSYRTSANDRERRVTSRRGRVSDVSSVDSTSESTPVSTPSTPVGVQKRVQLPKPATATTPTNSTEPVKKKRGRPRKSSGIATPPTSHVKPTEKILPSSPLVAKNDKENQNNIDKKQTNEINKSKNIENQQNTKKINSERIPDVKNNPSPIASNQNKISESDEGRDSKASRLNNIISKMAPVTENNRSPKTTIPVTVQVGDKRLKSRCFAEVTKKTDQRGELLQEQCIVCKTHNKKKKTKYLCPDCSVHLCIPLCFKRFHTMKKF
uniref:Transcription factor n=1 Tax=Molgula oculata TaxID=27575 RepID=Q9Y1M3_MOLOC|nr:transcription factor [Molgula oculata]